MKRPILPPKLRHTLKHEEEYIIDDCRKTEKNSKAIPILQYGVGMEEFDRTSSCTTAKEILNTLELAHECTC